MDATARERARAVLGLTDEQAREQAPWLAEPDPDLPPEPKPFEWLGCPAAPQT
jgi:hypothetical protein